MQETARPPASGACRQQGFTFGESFTCYYAPGKGLRRCRAGQDPSPVGHKQALTAVTDTSAASDAATAAGYALLEESSATSRRVFYIPQSARGSRQKKRSRASCAASALADGMG